MQICMNKLNQAYQCKITCLEEKNLHLNFMWSFGGNFFGLQNPTIKTKSDIYILKCIEGGGSTDLGNLFDLQNPTIKTKSDIYILKCIEGGVHWFRKYS